MTNLKSTLMTLCLVFVFAMTAMAGTPLNSLKGTFKNTNTASRGLTKIILTTSGNNVTVRPFGSCSPTDCDWGTKRGTAFAANISQSPSRNTEAIHATFKKGHATTFIVITPSGRGKIAVRSMTYFTDGSNRKPYASMEYFKKANIVRPTVLAAPVKLTRCNATYNHFPRKTSLKWKPVAGAVKYIVEVDCYQCCKVGKWCTDVGSKYKKETVRGTSFNFNFVGKQAGRWRVTAVDRRGKKGRTSSWCNFKYTK